MRPFPCSELEYSCFRKFFEWIYGKTEMIGSGHIRKINAGADFFRA